jgi:hypothetical protein
MLTPHADPWPRPEGFRVVSIATSLESPGTTFGPWRTNAYGMAWIVEGGGTTRYDEQVISTRPGSVLCVRPDTLARHDWGSARSFQAFVAFYADRFPPPWPAPETWPSLRQLQPDHVYFALFRALLGYDLKQETARACAVPLVELLLRVFVKTGARGTGRGGAADGRGARHGTHPHRRAA